MHLAPKLGVRECRRVLGEHVISVNDLKSGKLPDDTIALSHNGLDLYGEHVPRDWADCPLASIGPAAGTAAALAVQKQTGLRSLPIPDLQKQLKAAGVIGETASGAVGPCKGKC